MHVTLLGTGTSTGVPVIGCECRVCRSADGRDKRARCSVHIEARGLHLIIDTGPDFRQQALRYDLRRLDAVLYTHAHFDHTAGIDDLRPFLFGNPAAIPCYARDNTAAVLETTHHYIFGDRSYPGVPDLALHVVDGLFQVRGRYEPHARVDVLPIEALHGDLPIYGYRIGRFAYVTDASYLPESSYRRLEGLDVLVLNALRLEPHPTHFHVEAAVAAARRIGARRTYFTHMTHTLLHTEFEAALPAGMAPAYDGLSFTLPDE